MDHHSLTTNNRALDSGIVSEFQDYAAHGVQEYWIIDPKQQTLEPYQLDREFMRYEVVEPLTIKDELRSSVVQGFVIPLRALFDAAAYQQALKAFFSEE